jgi:hypothetical protein
VRLQGTAYGNFGIRLGADPDTNQRRDDGFFMRGVLSLLLFHF